MASEESPRRRRLLLPPAKPQAPALTTIHDLGDDLILEVFLRLPSLPSLVRAALACRAFLAAVRSSPDFRRRFRALRGPSILCHFLAPNVMDISSYVPLHRHSDPADFAAAAPVLDSFSDHAPYFLACSGWNIADCRGGYVLLRNWSAKQLAAYNPVTRALDLFPLLPFSEVRDRDKARQGGGCVGLGYHVVFSDEASRSFRVIHLCHNRTRVRIAVWPSGTREWQILPWSGPAPAQPSSNRFWLLNKGMQANGNLYWPHAEQAYMVVLDTRTLQFSFIDLPEQLKGQGDTYTIGETNDGKLCIVSATEFTLHVWFRGADVDGVEKWMLDSVIPLDGEVLQVTGGSLENHGGLVVLAILDLIVYLRTSVAPSWFMLFSLETRKLEKLDNKTYHRFVYPYIMAWPPSLVGNGVDP